MIIEPMGERVLLRALPKATQTSGGIYIPDSAKTQQKEAIVVAVGKYSNGAALPLQVNDQVIYSDFNSQELKLGEQSFIIIDFKDILAKVHHHV